MSTLPLIPPFSFFLEPHSLKSFIDEFYDKAPFAIHREDAQYYEALFSVKGFFECLNSPTLNASDFVVANKDIEVDPNACMKSDGSVDARIAMTLFEGGATLSIRNLQFNSRMIANICRGAEQAFTCPVSSNAYLTPPHSRGILTHHDTHDVIVLQISGSKHWRLYDAAIPSPLPGQSVVWDDTRLPRLRDEFVLHAGDFLYCPRGIPHNATATDEISLHVTLGLLSSTWTDVFFDVVADVALRDSTFRAALPAGYATHAPQQADIDRIFDSLLERLALLARPRLSLSKLGRDFIQRHPRLGTDPRPLPEEVVITADSRLGASPGLIFSLDRRAGNAVLSCYDIEVSVPETALETLREAMSSPSFIVEDLPGCMSLSSKIALVRRLASVGLVTVVC